MCDLGENTTGRKEFEKYRGSFSVSGKKEWLRCRPWQCRGRVPRHRHWARWDSPALLLPAQVPASVCWSRGSHPALPAHKATFTGTNWLCAKSTSFGVVHVLLKRISPAEWAEGCWLQAGLLREKHRHPVWRLEPLCLYTDFIFWTSCVCRRAQFTIL